jgi:RAB protein geranylgeranyltransferase component A
MNKLQAENDTLSDGLINFEKKRRVATLMEFIRKYQKEGYRFIKVDIIW